MRAIDRLLRNRPKAGGLSLLGKIRALFANGEQGWWYDPSDFNRYIAPLGPELVTNGDFSDGTTGWTANSASLSVSSGVLRVTSTGNAGNANQVIATVVGKTYKITGFVGDGTFAGVYIRVGTSANSGTFVSVTTAGDFSAYFTATTTTTYVTLKGGDTAALYREFDNITVKELTALDTATLFQDSAGTTPVTAMEQPVGLQLDLSKGLVLGPELVTNPGPFVTSDGWSNFTTGTTSIVSGALRVSTGASAFGGAYTSISTIVGKVYKVQVSSSFVSGGSASNARTYKADNTGNSVNKINGFAGSGAGSFVFTATATTTYINVASSTANDVFDWSNISVKELPGNHRFQSTSANRPVVSARVNLLTETEDFSDAAWSKGNATVDANTVVAPDGSLTADTCTATATSGVSLTRISNFGTLTNGLAYTASRYVKAGTKNFCTIGLFGLADAYFDLVNLTHSFTGAGAVSASIVDVGNGWRRVTATWIWGTGTTYWLFFGMASSLSSQAGLTVGDYQYIWGADLRVANQGVNLPVYQRVNTSTDYDSTGFPIYIKPNGSNQFMQTNSINFTATDKMTVWQGVRKLANNGLAMELSTDSSANAGSFYLFTFTTDAAYYFRSAGSIPVQVASAPIASPQTNIFTGIGDISGDVVTLRVNGAQVATSTANQGTGNYGNYPAYFYMRAGTSLPFNGHDYGSIARGAASTAAQITAGETYINSKTKAY